MAPEAAAEPAPAKLNFGLRITGRRPDGYHTLDSLFVPLSWSDEVEVEVEEGAGDAEVALRLEADGAPGPADVPEGPENLAARAARSFLEASGLGLRVRIRLRKRLPSGAGMGGGSSDAGAVLRALHRLRPDALAPDALAAVALGLGADVPFFLDPRPARVTGIGEHVEPVEGLPACWLVLANPGVSLATARVYAAWDARAGALTPGEAGSTMPSLSRLQDRLAAGSPRSSAARVAAPAAAGSRGSGPDPRIARAWQDLLVNDLEPAALELCPEIGRLREELVDAGALAAAMSGSGATVFGVLPDEPSARRAAERVGRRLAGGPGAPWCRVARSRASGRGGASPNW